MKLASCQSQMRSLFISILLLSCVILTSCDSGASIMGATPSGNGGRGCTKVGILLPESVSSVRWETKDHPLLVQAISTAIPNVRIDYNNAQGNSATQIQQADADLANGDCMLIVGAHDSVAAASIVAKARDRNVPVIAYDRLIQSKDLNYYVSFDNVRVGQLQGQYIAANYRQYQNAGAVNMVMISGSQTDTNALLFSLGVHSILDPLLAHNSIKKVAEFFTPNWNSSTAQAEVEATLTNQQNNLQVAYVANDDMAASVIMALQAVKLSGNVIVTGQDATATGIHNILTGAQSMTVYKPIAQEAASTGELVKALYNGSGADVLTRGAEMTTFDGGNIPSILDAPILVDRNNIATTVIADHYIQKSDVCMGVPVGTDGVC